MPPPAGPGLVRPLPPSATAPPVLPPNVKIKAGILLPLSGKNGPLGQAMLNAAQQAVFDAAAANFELMPRAALGPASYARFDDPL